jgi:hypothetical protein
MVKARLDTREWQSLGTELLRRAQRFPDIKRNYLQEVGRFGKSLIINVYENDVPSDIFYQHPTKDQGGYGETIVVNVRVGPKRSFAEITVMAPYADAIEEGRDPGNVPYEVIEEWAGRKLGQDDPQVIRAIVRAITLSGTLPRRLMFTALSPSTIYGKQWDQFAEEQAAVMLDELFPRDSGGRRRGRTSLGSR